jgi:hypothetical protein
MAAFADRFAIYQALAGQHPGWVVPVVLTSVGPPGRFMRATATALMPPDDESRPTRRAIVASSGSSWALCRWCSSCRACSRAC